MIITGYQGIGKSTLAKKRQDIIDLESSCFWKIDENGNKTRPSDWYVYYCQMAEFLSKQGYIVFISCHPEVREYMENHRTETFCAIFPHKSLKDAWISKLRERYYCTKSEKDLRALEHAEKFYDKDIDRLIYECSYGIGCQWYSNVVYLETIDYDLESIIESLLTEIYQEQLKTYNKTMEK